MFWLFRRVSTALRRELQLLGDSGRTPYDAFGSATAVPASSSGVVGEFGTITIGKQAGIPPVDDNPLKTIDQLRMLSGVKSSGKWIRCRQLE